MNTLIQTNGLTKLYKSNAVVNDVSITINEGSIVGLVGRNGAGKTTLIRILTGLIQQTSGSFEIMPGQERLSTSVAAIVERPSIYMGMTGIDNLKAQSLLLGLKVDNAYLKQMLKFVGLDSESKVKAKNYSLGMKQRLAIAMTIVGRPKLLILDEPTNGLDPQGIRDMRELFVKINKALGVTLIVSSHILSELGKFATEFYFMEQGMIINKATSEEILHNAKKRTLITVSNAKKAINLLSQYNASIVDSNTVEIMDDVSTTQILKLLSRKDVDVSHIQTLGDDLESYFIDLLKGGK